jgi:cellulose synthase/poly-beta-1,6-N-acetylglucosamine synthase-like glycosyltransferase
MATCLFIAAAVLLLLAQHPFVTYPLSLFAWRALARKPVALPLELPNRPSLSVLCCCHNEAAVMDRKVRNMREAAARYSGTIEFLFYLDDCTDNTGEAIAAADPGARIVKSKGRTGKSVGMKELVSLSTGEILVFTDANTFLDQNVFIETARGLSDPAIGGVAGTLEYTNSGESEIARVSGLYWQLEEWIKRLESDTGTTLGADGAYFAIRRALYVPTPPDIIDDMHTSMNVVLVGSRFISLESVRTFEKTPTKSRDEFRRKVRIVCRAFNCYRLIASRLHRSGAEVVYKFYSHKVIRWFCLPLALAGCLCLIAALIAEGHGLLAAMLVAITVLILLAGMGGVRPFAALYEIALSLLAAMLGVYQSLRGERYQTWTIASSGR